MRSARTLSAGTLVKIKAPWSVPQWSTWDDDGQRTYNSVQKRLQTAFFKGDRRVQARIVYVSSEHERFKLNRNGHLKLELRDPAGVSVTILAATDQVIAAVRASGAHSG